jgi:hypothetical protein
MHAGKEKQDARYQHDEKRRPEIRLFEDQRRRRHHQSGRKNQA